MRTFLEPIRSFLELGGPVVAILLVLSILSLAISGMKLITLLHRKVGRHGSARKALQLWFLGRRREAKLSLDGSNSAVDKALWIGMTAILSGNAIKDNIEDEISGIAMRDLHELRRGFRALEAVSQVAPLLGLFGTVIGMIDAFQKLQSAGNSVDPSILAGGIWVALLTTAAGLAVAMPVSLILTYFETRVDDEAVAIQTMTSELLSDGSLPTHAETSSAIAETEVEYAT